MQPADPKQILTADVEQFVEYFGTKNELPTKSEMVNALKYSVGVTNRGMFDVKTRRGLFTMSRTKLHEFLGGALLNYVNDDVVSENVADFVEKSKKNLILVKPT
jgi:hypothetical protein